MSDASVTQEEVDQWEEDDGFEGTTTITIRIPSAEGDQRHLTDLVESALNEVLWDDRNDGTIGEAEVSSTWTP